MSNRTSSSSSGDLTIVRPGLNGTTDVSTSSSDSDSSEDSHAHGHHDKPKPCHGGNGEYDVDLANATRSPLVVAAPDNDGIEPGKLTGLLVAGVVLVAAALLAFLVRRRLKRTPLYAPTPSLVLQLHTRHDDSPDPDTVCAASFRPLGKHRGSTATTSASELSGRSSFSTVVAAARRFSKASSTGTTSAADGALLTSACVDPVITAARIPLDDIVVHEMVGRGAFGEVYRGTYDQQTVAVKRIVADRRSDLVYIEGFLSEVKFLARLEHAYIVRFRGVAWDALTDLCVVSEFMDGGDLRARLHRFERVEHRPKGFDAEKTKIALHVAHAVAYLHSLSPVVLHRDLKSRNILLDRDHNAKLADFGVARERMDSTAMSAGVGSSLWMAPEVMVGDRYDEKADIYSFGVVLAELNTHSSPYAHAREPRDGMRRIPEGVLLQMVSMGKLQLEFSASCDAVSRQMVELARQCIAREPSARPTAAQVLHRIHLIYRKVAK